MRFIISLQNDSSGNVVAATYTVFDPQGNMIGNHTTDLLSIGAKLGSLAPIIAFELNLVGPVNSESAILASGAGTIVYQAANTLTAFSMEPACAESGYVTAETANSFYGELPATPSQQPITQTFSVNGDAPMIHKRGKRRPGVAIPPRLR
jgi:hypothetical protein